MKYIELITNPALLLMNPEYKGRISYTGGEKNMAKKTHRLTAYGSKQNIRAGSSGKGWLKHGMRINPIVDMVTPLLEFGASASVGALGQEIIPNLLSRLTFITNVTIKPIVNNSVSLLAIGGIGYGAAKVMKKPTIFYGMVGGAIADIVINVVALKMPKMLFAPVEAVAPAAITPPAVTPATTTQGLGKLLSLGDVHRLLEGDMTISGVGAMSEENVAIG